MQNNPKYKLNTRCSSAGARVLRADITAALREHDAHATQGPAQEPGELGGAGAEGCGGVRSESATAAQRLRKGHSPGAEALLAHRRTEGGGWVLSFRFPKLLILPLTARESCSRDHHSYVRTPLESPQNIWHVTCSCFVVLWGCVLLYGRRRIVKWCRCV